MRHYDQTLGVTYHRWMQRTPGEEWGVVIEHGRVTLLSSILYYDVNVKKMFSDDTLASFAGIDLEEEFKDLVQEMKHR